MLLNGYSLEIFRSKCNAGAKSLHCYAHLHNDVSEALPYVNTVLGGFGYLKDPPTLTLRSSGKLITIHPEKIAVNALEDEVQAKKIVNWLQREINSAWENRITIIPSFESAKKPKLIQILKLLPQTNCKKCGEATCMVFSVLVTEGVKDHTNCPEMENDKKKEMATYLGDFNFL